MQSSRDPKIQADPEKPSESPDATDPANPATPLSSERPLDPRTDEKRSYSLDDLVDESSDESFPASDPPGWHSLTIT